ncbi:MAG TPA: hypothetical protein VN670_09540 [Acidobacteriaceae bacterium]|nr:hypothetical protein [Acidobacteriaceae bacterium]
MKCVSMLQAGPQKFHIPSTDWRRGFARAVGLFTVALFCLSATTLMAQEDHDDAFLPNPVRSVSTVPSNGDVNPYGVAFVPDTLNAGKLHPGNILVSNFNAKSNLQGTGTTIVQVPRAGNPTAFFHGATGLGLSTALQVLKAGFVLVGNFPSANGTCANAQAGSILALTANGKVFANIVDPNINGPWDSTVIDRGNEVTLFVANGLSGTVSRIVLAQGPSGPYVKSSLQIGSGYQHQCDAVTFVDAPTGLVYDWRSGDLFVASTMDNKIYALHDAATINKDQGTGRVIYEDNKHLHGPLAMAMAPNGHLLVSNNDAINPDPNQPSEIVEFTVEGKFVKQLSVDPSAGASFGLNVMTEHGVSTFAAVDDATNMLLIWKLPQD